MNSENYERHKAKGSGGFGCCNLIINGVLAYYFYQYSYNNPDPGQCWATDGTPASATERSGYTNVSQ